MDVERKRPNNNPLLNTSTQDRIFDTMSAEIEQMLVGITAFDTAHMHTLERHILQDYTREKVTDRPSRKGKTYLGQRPSIMALE